MRRAILSPTARAGALLLAVLLVGCGTAPLAGPDAGDAPDAGISDLFDGGVAEDGGIPEDGGLAALDGGVAPDAGPACSATSPRSIPVKVAIFPDEGETPYVSVLARAQESIRVMVYLMGTGGILDTLRQKAREGKSVQVILDQGQSSNQRYYDDLTDAGAQVTWSNPAFAYMHAKMFVVDGREAFLSSGNYSRYSIQRERNYGALLADPQDVSQLVALFDADWDGGATPSLGCTRLVVSPVNSRARVLELIRSATQTLLLEEMQFADTEVRDAVAERLAAGVSIRALLADPSWIDRNQDAATWLAAKGIPARWMATPGVHAKAIIVDGTRAFVGSENLSWTSLNKNRELGVVVLDPGQVASMAVTFENDWASATPF